MLEKVAYVSCQLELSSAARLARCTLQKCLESPISITYQLSSIGGGDGPAPPEPA